VRCRGDWIQRKRAVFSTFRKTIFVNNGSLKTQSETYNFSTYGYRDCDCLFDLQDDSQGCRTIRRRFRDNSRGCKTIRKLQDSSKGCRVICKTIRELQSDSEAGNAILKLLEGIFEGKAVLDC
jgi:hypothetical protein